MRYEYLIKKFADDSGHTAQEFYTNRYSCTFNGADACSEIWRSHSRKANLTQSDIQKRSLLL